MRVLLTNDDGIEAPGIAALCRAAEGLGDLHVIAPSKVRSACGHAVTLHRPLEAWDAPVLDEDGEEIIQGTALYGMPADCVKVGLAKLIEEPVDLVLSGINAGCNVGVHTLYSGTVAAAREAALIGVPAVALSLFLGKKTGIRWRRAAELARECLETITRQPLESGVFLNVNLPILDNGAEPKGICVVPASVSPMIDDYQGDTDEEGKLKLTIGRHVSFGEIAKGSDVEALFDGYITVTPMIVDVTDHDALGSWRKRIPGKK